MYNTIKYLALFLLLLSIMSCRINKNSYSLLSQNTEADKWEISMEIVNSLILYELSLERQKDSIILSGIVYQKNVDMSIKSQSFSLNPGVSNIRIYQANLMDKKIVNIERIGVTDCNGYFIIKTPLKKGTVIIFDNQQSIRGDLLLHLFVFWKNKGEFTDDISFNFQKCIP